MYFCQEMIYVLCLLHWVVVGEGTDEVDAVSTYVNREIHGRWLRTSGVKYVIF